MKKNQKTPFALALGVSLLSGLATTSQAESNPFAMNELSAGYLQTAETKPEQGSDQKMPEGACGEGKCGAAMMKKGDTKQPTEGKCAGNKPAAPAPTDGKAQGDK